jgi:hypothetical protein
VVDLQAHPVGILEQDGIVAGGVAVVLGSVNDPRADPDQEGVRFLDILAASRAKTDVMQADDALLEPVAGIAAGGA